MLFANEASDKLQRANPTIELALACLLLLGGFMKWLDIFLQHRKNKTPWTRQQIWMCVALVGLGLMCLMFYLTD